MSNLGTNDVDIKMKTRPNGLWDFDTDEDGDFNIVTGGELAIQRIKHRLLVRKRFYPHLPPGRPRDEGMHLDEDGNPYVPGELENLGYPDYGSTLQYYVGVNDYSYFQGLLFLDITQAIAQEAELINIASVDDLRITKIEEGKYEISISLTLGETEEIIEETMVIGT